MKLRYFLPIKSLSTQEECLGYMCPRTMSMWHDRLSRKSFHRDAPTLADGWMEKMKEKQVTDRTCLSITTMSRRPVRVFSPRQQGKIPSRVGGASTEHTVVFGSLFAPYSPMWKSNEYVHGWLNKRSCFRCSQWRRCQMRVSWSKSHLFVERVLSSDSILGE